MKQYLVGGLAAALITGGLVGSAPPASAGCLYGGWMAASRCDRPSSPTAPGNVAWYSTRRITDCLAPRPTTAGSITAASDGS